MPFRRQPDPMLLATRLAALCEKELATRPPEAALVTLGGIFRRELTPGLEYIALMGPTGFTHVHTNAMREGRVHDDAANLAAAALVPSAAVAAVADSPAVGAAVVAAGAVIAGRLAVWNDRRISRPIAEFNATTRAVSEGDLTATVSGVGRDELAQMGFELNKVVPGLKRVIQAGAASTAAVSDLADNMAARTGETAGAMAEIAASCRTTHEKAERRLERVAKAVEAAGRVTTGLDCVGRSADRTQSVLGSARDAAVAGSQSLDEAAGAMASAAEVVREGTARVQALRERGQAIEASSRPSPPSPPRRTCWP